MHDVASRPRRMRYSYESRCRAVEAMLDGMSPAEAARSVGASRATGYRCLERSSPKAGPGSASAPPRPGASRARGQYSYASMKFGRRFSENAVGPSIESCMPARFCSRALPHSCATSGGMLKPR